MYDDDLVDHLKSKIWNVIKTDQDSQHFKFYDLVLWGVELDDEYVGSEPVLLSDIDDTDKEMMLGGGMISSAYEEPYPTAWAIDVIVERPRVQVVTPPQRRSFADYTLKEVDGLFEITNIDNPLVSDLPRFNGIQTALDDSKLSHKNAKTRLMDDLESRITAFGTDSPASLDETTNIGFVSSYLMQAILALNGGGGIDRCDVFLRPKRSLQGELGQGVTEFAIEPTTMTENGRIDQLGVVTLVKPQHGLSGALAQNMMMLECILTARETEQTLQAPLQLQQDSNNNSKNGDRLDHLVPKPAQTTLSQVSVPMSTEVYGIVADAENWYFLECSLTCSVVDGQQQEQQQQEQRQSRPKFKVSTKRVGSINYGRDSWRQDASALLGEIIWLLQQMQQQHNKTKMQRGEVVEIDSAGQSGCVQNKRTSESQEGAPLDQ
ncbi:hypothetical protein BGZ83_011398, partial [Gryganskiella cystojenkinii]